MTQYMEDRYETLTRDELLSELRGLLFRYEQFRNTTLPTLNKVTEERDELSRRVALLEARLDQVGEDLAAIAEARGVHATAHPRSLLHELGIMAVAAYERAMRRRYLSDEPLDEDF